MINENIWRKVDKWKQLTDKEGVDLIVTTLKNTNSSKWEYYKNRVYTCLGKKTFFKKLNLEIGLVENKNGFYVFDITSFYQTYDGDVLDHNLFTFIVEKGEHGNLYNMAKDLFDKFQLIEKNKENKLNEYVRGIS